MERAFPSGNIATVFEPDIHIKPIEKIREPSRAFNPYLPAVTGSVMDLVLESGQETLKDLVEEC